MAATQITLVQDVSHKDLANELKAKTLDNAGKLIITSAVEKSLIVPQGSTWDLSSYTCIEFTGNARLVCEPGSRLHGAGGVLRFRDESRFIVGKE
jgi:hypothetical protein